jgi:hypothetical protein
MPRQVGHRKLPPPPGPAPPGRLGPPWRSRRGWPGGFVLAGLGGWAGLAAGRLTPVRGRCGGKTGVRRLGAGLLGKATGEVMRGRRWREKGVGGPRRRGHSGLFLPLRAPGRFPLAQWRAVRLGWGPQADQGGWGLPRRGEPGESGHGGDAEGHGGLGFPALPGHGPALGRGRKTHKNSDLTAGPRFGPGDRSEEVESSASLEDGQRQKEQA